MGGCFPSAFHWYTHWIGLIMQTKEKERESLENYLASILSIERVKGICYSIDVSRDLDVAKASVSVAMKKLIDTGYISFGESHEIILNHSGEVIGKDVLAKRKLIKEALMRIGVSEENAEADAHQIEHFISKETNKKLFQYLKANIKQ